MTGLLFPGQAAQFTGMGKEMYETSAYARDLFEQANEILGFRISDIMFTGTIEELTQTRVTQPSVFLHSIITFLLNRDSLTPAAVAGHSLGEFTALVAAGSLSFEDGLRLVQVRADAMQKACEENPSTMAAIVGLDDAVIEEICAGITPLVVPANYNCPGQLVISGTNEGVDIAIEKLKEAGAKMAVKIAVGGAFHSPLMESAKEPLTEALAHAHLEQPVCPIYQNVNAGAETNADTIRRNLIDQLTAPVRWTQTMQNMIASGVTEFVEVGGNGKVLQGFIKRLDRGFPSRAI